MFFQSMRHHRNHRLNLRDIDNLYVIIPEVFAGYKCPMRSGEQVNIRFGIGRENRQGKDITLAFAPKIIQDFTEACNTSVCDKLDKKVSMYKDIIQFIYTFTLRAALSFPKGLRISFQRDRAT